MAISSRKDSEELLMALVYALNTLQGHVVADGYHRDLTQNTNGPLFNQSGITLTTVTVSATNAVDLTTMVNLSNNLLGVLNQHMYDDQAHLKRDFTNQPNGDGYLTVQANLFSDGGLASSIINLNAMKALFAAHLTASGVHVNNDTTVYGLPADATNLATAETLANALKTAVNAHMANAGSNYNSPRINIIST